MIQTIDSDILTASQCKYLMSDICNVYLSDERPWIIGYSGGKDSTALLQLVYYSMLTLPVADRFKEISVLSSDTRVEAPYIEKRVQNELARVQATANRDKIPLDCSIVYPEIQDSFWVNLIGRGYPSPNRWFRWCTDRLKIRPISKYIREQVDNSGDVIIVLGARFQESASRTQTLRKNRVTGEIFRPHPDITQAWIYTPIEHLSNNNIWHYLLQVPSPWGGENKQLVALYRQASKDGECPLVIDNSTPPCGNSRFGCWTCTVIDKDKSMEALVDAGDETLEPLLDLRDYLKRIRDDLNFRDKTRRDGSEGPGPFNIEARQQILRKLLITQQVTDFILIGGDELAAIQDAWIKDGISPFAIRQIWQSVFQEVPIPMSKNEFLEQLSFEEKLLYDVCEKENISFDLVSSLLQVEQQYASMKRRTGLPEELRTIFQLYIEKGGD